MIKTRFCKECLERQEKIDKFEKENEQLKALCDTYRTCYQAKHSKHTETEIIDDFVRFFAEIIAEEQPDCKNIDYRLPETKRICIRLQEIENEIINVARALQFNSGKSKPLGETGYPRSYKRWEKQLRKRLAHEHLI